MVSFARCSRLFICSSYVFCIDLVPISANFFAPCCSVSQEIGCIKSLRSGFSHPCCKGKQAKNTLHHSKTGLVGYLGSPPYLFNLGLVSLGKPHVGSFNYMMEDGLKLAVQDIDPQEFIYEPTGNGMLRYR